MSNTILIKRSGIQGKVPGTADLVYGEIAINTFDGKAYIKINDGIESVAEIGRPIAVDLNVDRYYFNGDGATTEFLLSKTPTSNSHLIITINGIIQETTTYTLSGHILTFSSAPELYDTIETRSFTSINETIKLRNYKKYIFNITSSTPSITGTDSTGNTLKYDADGVDVYKNGLRLIQNIDYVANTGYSIQFTTNLINPDKIEVLSYGKAFISSSDLTTSSVSLTTSVAYQIVDTFDASLISTAKYLCQIKHNADIHATEIILTHNGTNVYTTVYGSIYSNVSLGIFSASINSGSVSLLFSPISINTLITVKRMSI